MMTLTLPFISPIAGIAGLGSTELIIIFLVILLLFGGSKLPALARALGQSKKEFQKAARGEDEESKPKDSDASKSKNGTH